MMIKRPPRPMYIVTAPSLANGNEAFPSTNSFKPNSARRQARLVRDLPFPTELVLRRTHSAR